MTTPDDLRHLQTTAPLVFEADSIPYTPGYRQALCTWLNDHGINADETIRFEIWPGTPATIAAVCCLRNADGHHYPDPATGLIATERVAGVPVVRDLPRQEDFGFGQPQGPA